jgi:hypothetical protein
MTATAIWPNFFIAGAPKAGTTALYEFLRQHPQVYLSPIKEPTFFARADLVSWRWREETFRAIARDRETLAEYLAGPMRETCYWRLVLDEADYLRLFAGARHRPAVGEASVSYFWQPHAADSIAARVPDARLIFVLRDPAERTYSQYLASLHGRPGPSFRAQFLSATDPAARLAPWLDCGRYATNLGRYLAVFPRQQIRVFLYEEYRTDPRAVVREIFRFLGVDPDHPVETARQHNAPAVPRSVLLHRWRTRLLGRRRLMPLVPPALRPLARWIYLRNRSRMRMAPADRRMVVDYYRDEIERTADLLGRDLSAWLR